jgi:hypothetical protein
VLEVADIIRAAGPAYREACGPRLLPSHRRGLDDLATCRTAARGGHLRRCDHCDESQYQYHSCRNRHCPKCHGQQTRRWLDLHRSRLLPCPYFLVTFTLPDALRAVARSHQRTVYDALVRAAAETLLTLAADPQHLGGRPAILAVLHTWTQDLRSHPHVHVLITGGGLAPNSTRWVPTARPDFLFPGYVLSPVFRGTLRQALRQAGLHDQVAPDIWTRDWVVHVQSAGSGQQVLEYLGRYVFRIAITNSRLEQFDQGRVTFRYRHRRDGHTKRRTLPAQQFLARFLQHVLPRGFAKVRHYGLASPTCRRLLDVARAALPPAPASVAAPSVPDDPVSTADAQRAVIPDADRCPSCHVGRLLVVAILPRARPP